MTGKGEYQGKGSGDREGKMLFGRGVLPTPPRGNVPQECEKHPPMP